MFAQKTFALALVATAALTACASDVREETHTDGHRDTTLVISAAEQQATIAAMRPPKRARPLVAVIAQNDGAETTDYIIPYSVLGESGAVDVIALATEARAL